MATPDIRVLEKRDRETSSLFLDLARLHSEEIQDGFLTSLGIPVLAKLYQGISTSPDAFIVVASAGGKTVGFLCASADTRRVYRGVLTKQWRALVLAAAPRLISWPTIKRAIETLRYPTRRRLVDLPPAEILNFCVTHRMHRSGIGGRLFAAMIAEFRRRGVRKIRIVTGSNQHSAIAFYEKIGASLVDTIAVHADTASKVFSYPIPDVSDESRRL